MSVTTGHPATGKTTVVIDYGDGTRITLDWQQWEDWQGQRLNELVRRSDVLRDFEPGPQH